MSLKNQTYKNILSKGLFSSLKDTDIENGKIRVATDTRQMFLDDDGERKEISSFIKGLTEDEIKDLLAPLPKFYFSSDTHKFFYYTSEGWVELYKPADETLGKTNPEVTGTLKATGTITSGGDLVANDGIKDVSLIDVSRKIVIVDSELSDTSENAIQNKVVKSVLDNKADKATTLAGYGITDAIHTIQIDGVEQTKTDGIVNLPAHYKTIELTKAQYDAEVSAGTIDDDTYYVITDDNGLSDEISYAKLEEKYIELQKKIGTIPETAESTNVVDYVQEVAAETTYGGIASDLDLQEPTINWDEVLTGGVINDR